MAYYDIRDAYAVHEFNINIRCCATNIHYKSAHE